MIKNLTHPSNNNKKNPPKRFEADHPNKHYLRKSTANSFPQPTPFCLTPASKKFQIIGSIQNALIIPTLVHFDITNEIEASTPCVGALNIQ